MGIFDKIKNKIADMRKDNSEAKVDKKLIIKKSIEDNPVKFVSMSKQIRKDWEFALTAIEKSKDEEELKQVWEAIDKSLKTNSNFINSAIKQKAVVVKMLEPNILNDLIKAKNVYYNVNKETLQYFSSNVQREIRREESASRARREALEKMKKNIEARAARKKEEAEIARKKEEAEIARKKAEEEAEASRKRELEGKVEEWNKLFPEQAALIKLINTLQVKDKIKNLDPEKDAEKIDAIKADAYSQIEAAVAAVGTMNVLDMNDNSLFYNFFKNNKDVFIWQVLKALALNYDDVEIDDKAIKELESQVDVDSSLLEDVKKYNQYHEYWKGIKYGKLKLDDIPEEFRSDPSLRMLATSPKEVKLNKRYIDSRHYTKKVRPFQQILERLEHADESGITLETKPEESELKDNEEDGTINQEELRNFLNNTLTEQYIDLQIPDKLPERLKHEDESGLTLETKPEESEPKHNVDVDMLMREEEELRGSLIDRALLEKSETDDEGSEMD